MNKVKSKLKKHIRNIFYLFIKLNYKLGRRFFLEDHHRIWSNNELKKFAHLFTGSICNVSGWKDSTRDGKNEFYQNYFINKSSYTITNFSGQRGFRDIDKNISLDLTKPLKKELINKYDVVFNHTTLEHIYEIDIATRNLSELTNDILIIVVPFMQEQHYEKKSYGDYWRFTQLTLHNIFLRHNIYPLYMSSNDHQPWYPIYLFYVGTKKPQNWNKKFNFNLEKYLDHKIGSNVQFW